MPPRQPKKPSQREQLRGDMLRILQRERAEGLQVGQDWLEAAWESVPGVVKLVRTEICVRWHGEIRRVASYDAWDRARRNGLL